MIKFSRYKGPIFTLKKDISVTKRLTVKAGTKLMYQTLRNGQYFYEAV